jgi:hypothetical protein
MPRRELLTAARREALLAFPDEEENLLQHYVLRVRDLAASAGAEINLAMARYLVQEWSQANLDAPRRKRKERSACGGGSGGEKVFSPDKAKMMFKGIGRSIVLAPLIRASCLMKWGSYRGVWIARTF